MIFLRIVIIVVSLVVAACASHEPKLAKTQAFFNTLIKRDGVKQFSYTLMMEAPASDKRGGAGKRGGPRGGHGGGHGEHPDGPPSGDHERPKGDKNRGEDEGMADRFNVMFSESLNAKLSDTGFCQRGYKEVDRKSRTGVIQITGECNEVATAEDKVKFPNPAPVKVKEQVIE